MIKILDAEQTSLAEILARTEDQRDISGIVSRIIEDVRQSGDEALRRYTKEFDHTRSSPYGDYCIRGTAVSD